MRKNGGTLNAQLARVISECGHTDSLVVADAGLPVPRDTERVDLALRAGEPGLLSVLETVLGEFQIERAVIASEMKVISPEMHQRVLQLLQGVGIVPEEMAHADLKRESATSRAIIRSGEFTPYSNVVLYSGVPF